MRSFPLNERQIEAVKYVKEKGAITNREFKELIGVSKATATRDLMDLVRKNIFSSRGTGKREVKYALHEPKMSQKMLGDYTSDACLKESCLRFGRLKPVDKKAEIIDQGGMMCLPFPDSHDETKKSNRFYGI